MPGIKSDIMNKTLPSSQGMREFEVSDEPVGASDDQMEAIKQQFAARGMTLDENTLRALQAKQSMASERNAPKTMMDIEKDFSDARKFKANPGKTRLSENAKRRIEMLSGLKRNTRTCLIGEYEYVLQTLKNIELREAILAAAAFDGTIELPFETRKQLVARALTHVAGSEVGLFLGDDSLEAKLDFLEELEERITSKLYDEYLLLVAEVTAKYSVKDEADAKEIADDLKK